AIARLRAGISSLNREGRERLLAAFELVNTSFTQLFTRLFGGGHAHLKLTEAEDPLEAGLEIMASPPGKRLQVMSLLSGGEQALTALSLLFAVFLTNPAPICVLDEVDAPLDDANVDRFCSLVEELAHTTSTRFLVITHHRMTMARMDRLFGVTMAERGVSQLVSVDLHQVPKRGAGEWGRPASPLQERWMLTGTIEEVAEQAERVLSAVAPGAYCVPQEWDSRIDCLIALPNGSVVGEMIRL